MVEGRPLWRPPRYYGRDGARPSKNLELDRVALHLVVKRRTLNAEDLRGFLLVPVALGERRDDGVALHVVEILDAVITAHGLLKHRRQLHFRRQFFHADLILTGEHDR